MGQAKQRSDEIKKLKIAGNHSRNFAINFKFHLVDEEDYRYNMLAVYPPKVVEEIRGCDYDNDKCFDIITEHSHNLLVRKAGNADMTDAAIAEQVQASMRVVSLAVLRMALLDPYKEIVVQPNTVLDMTLEEVDDRIGFNLIPGMPNSMLLAQKGVEDFIADAPNKGVDFIITMK